MKDCKIIRDLFPSYIDELTNEDTNQFIEEHLKHCEDCKRVLEGMRKELRLDSTKKDSKEVKYIKKYNKKMKILKMALLVVLLIVIFNVVRNMIIIVSLDNKMNNYATSKNYYIKQINYSEDSLLITEIHQKDNKYIKRYTIISELIKVVSTDYYNGKTTNNYYDIRNNEENISKKIATLNRNDDIISPVIPNAIEIDNPINFIITSLFSSITSENCNGKDCYRVAIKEPTNSLDTIYYIDKETGLAIRSLGTGAEIKNDGERYDFITDYQYEFDSVTDDDFIEPDIGEYEITE